MTDKEHQAATAGQGGISGSPSGATVPPEPVPSDLSDAAPVEKPKSGCRGCFKGCLITLGVFVLVLALGAGWFFNVPARLGIVASPSEEFYSASSNPWAEEAVIAELTAEGIALDGVSVWVQSSPDSDAMIAYILVDGSRGATWDVRGEYRSAVEGFLVYTALTQAATDYGIERVAVDHWDESGTQAAIMTAPTSVLRDFAAGTISKEQLYEQMDGYADFVGFLGGMSE